VRIVRAAVLVVLLATPALAQRSPAVRPDWRGRGVVMALMPAPSSLHATRPVIVIHHQPIAGLMADEMSMPFIVASPDLMRDLHPGDRITFGLKETADALLVVTIDRLGATAP
jgi:copper binding protein CusF